MRQTLAIAAIVAALAGLAVAARDQPRAARGGGYAEQYGVIKEQPNLDELLWEGAASTGG
jgi:uncharacterized membrane protein